MWNLIIGVAAILFLLFLYYQVLKRCFRERLHNAEVHTVKTGDLWKLRLCRYRKPDSQGQPVLLVHGITANHHAFASPHGKSLIDHLMASGHDCWAIDLRGCRSSIPPFERSFRDCTLDQYLNYDLPATLDYIRTQTGHAQVHWVGHSMGGMLLYAYAQVHGEDQIASGITLGSPIGFDGVKSKPPRFLLLLVRCCPKLLIAVVRGLTPLGRILRISFPYFPANLWNINRGMRSRHFFTMLDTPLPQVQAEMAHWLRSHTWRMLDNTVDIKAGLNTLRFPLLAFYGPKDPFVPLDQARRFMEALPHDDKQMRVLSKKEGCKYNYNHVDLVFGKHGEQEVFAPIAAWITKHPSREMPVVAAPERPETTATEKALISDTALLPAEVEEAPEAPESTPEPPEAPATPPESVEPAPSAASLEPEPEPEPEQGQVVAPETPPEERAAASETKDVTKSESQDEAPLTAEASPVPDEALETRVPEVEAGTEQAQETTAVEEKPTEAPTSSRSNDLDVDTTTPAQDAPLKADVDSAEKAAITASEPAASDTPKPSAKSKPKKKAKSKAKTSAKRSILLAEKDAKKPEADTSAVVTDDAEKEVTAPKNEAKDQNKDKTPFKLKAKPRKGKKSAGESSGSKSRSDKNKTQAKGAAPNKGADLPVATRRAIAQAGDLMRAVSEPRMKSPGDGDKDQDTEDKAKNQKGKGNDDA